MQVTFHQLLLNGNVTAITSNLLLGSWNKVILAFCVSFHFISWETAKIGPNVPKVGEIGGRIRFSCGVLGEFNKITTCNTC